MLTKKLPTTQQENYSRIQLNASPRYWCARKKKRDDETLLPKDKCRESDVEENLQEREYTQDISMISRAGVQKKGMPRIRRRCSEEWRRSRSYEENDGCSGMLVVSCSSSFSVLSHSFSLSTWPLENNMKSINPDIPYQLYCHNWQTEQHSDKNVLFKRIPKKKRQGKEEERRLFSRKEKMTIKVRVAHSVSSGEEISDLYNITFFLHKRYSGVSIKNWNKKKFFSPKTTWILLFSQLPVFLSSLLLEFLIKEHYD